MGSLPPPSIHIQLYYPQVMCFRASHIPSGLRQGYCLLWLMRFTKWTLWCPVWHPVNPSQGTEGFRCLSHWISKHSNCRGSSIAFHATNIIGFHKALDKTVAQTVMAGHYAKPVAEPNPGFGQGRKANSQHECLNYNCTICKCTYIKQQNLGEARNAKSQMVCNGMLNMLA